MRLELYGAAANDSTQISSSSLSGAAAAKQTTSPKTGGIEDKTTLSSGADSVNTLTKAALQGSASRAEKVAALKQAVSSSQYKLDATKIASALSTSEF